MAEQTITEEWWQGGSGRQRQPRRQGSAKATKRERSRVIIGSLGRQEGNKGGILERKKVVVEPARGRRSRLQKRYTVADAE